MTKRAGILVVAGLGLAACSDGVGPPPRGLERPDISLKHLVWSPAIGTPSFAAVRNDPVAEGPEQAMAASAVPILDNYETSFWARRGKSTGIEIRYRDADGSWKPYIQFTIPKDGLYRRPDGSLFGQGDSVLISVRVDTTYLLVHFEPTGLVFNPSAPAQFKVWYTGASGDLDGNGIVDGNDEYIRQVLLGVWVQEHPGDPWENVEASHSLDDRLFTAGLQHFSGYAVSH
ncbi:MAG: hypothetical protein KatS3mg081_0143 [Gemmatimonadales bacterium]|nr:MAG: hypothetical protein KatS3mg081_0143 [Gemmatimonadales bacterium]